MKRLSFPLLIIALLSFILVQSCSTEENTVTPIVQTPEPEGQVKELDSDGDGVIDSEDYKPYNPFLTYDDWGESKDEYSELFYTSDISELDIEGMIRDFRMIEDNLGKFGGEFYFIGSDIEAALELAQTYCTRRVER